MKLTRSALIKLISPYVNNKQNFDVIIQEIINRLQKRHIVTINKFGKFQVVKSKSGYGRNFHSNEKIKLIPKYKVKFIASKIVEKLINNKK